MSLINDITGAVGFRPQGQQPTLGTGQQPGAPTPAAGLRSYFSTTFNAELATQFERGAAGEFDDPTLVLQEQAALARFRAAQQAATSSTGATAAPDAQPSTGAIGTTSATGNPAGATTAGTGTAATIGAAAGAGAIGGGANAAPTAAAGVAEQRELYAIRLRNSEARLQNISTKLNAEYPQAAKLASASTGWDPEQFVPKSRAEAEAFAQRMVIDATEAAARLDIVTNQLDAAKLEAATTGTPAAKELVTRLQADLDRQKAYVDKLARIVDTASSGTLTDAGAEALAGNSLRGPGDISARELATALRASGMDEKSIKRVVGAGEMAVEEDVTERGSVRLQKVATEAATWTWVNRSNLQAARRREEAKIEQRRAEEDRRADDKRADRRAGERRQARRAQDARAQEDRAEFSQYLQKLAAEASQRSVS